MSSTIQQIKSRVNIVELVSRYVDIRRAGGSEWKGKCPFHEEKTGSFTVQDQDQFFYCFGCGAKGDVISFLEQYLKIPTGEAIKKICATYGIENKPDPNYYKRKIHTPKIKTVWDSPRVNEERYKSSVKIATERTSRTGDKEKEKSAKTRKRIGRIIRESSHDTSLTIQNYMHHRGLDDSYPMNIMFHKSLDHYDYKTDKTTYWPAMVSLVFGPDHYEAPPVAVHRTYLNHRGKGKAPVQMPKKILGKYKGGAIWFGGSATPHLDILEGGEVWICEGVETGVALWQYLHDYEKSRECGWIIMCAMAANNLPSLTIPQTATKVVVCGDYDPPDKKTGKRPGHMWAEKAVHAYRCQGFDAEMKMPKPTRGQRKIDWLDVIAEKRKAGLYGRNR